MIFIRDILKLCKQGNIKSTSISCDKFSTVLSIRDADKLDPNSLNFEVIALELSSVREGELIVKLEEKDYVALCKDLL